MTVLFNNSYVLDYHIGADFVIRALGWNMMPFFMSSPQFLSLAISKSNLLLAVSCCCISICVLAAASYTTPGGPYPGVYSMS